MGLALTEEAVRKIVHEEVQKVREELIQLVELCYLKTVIKNHIDQVKINAAMKYLDPDGTVEILIDIVASKILEDGEMDPLLTNLEEYLHDIGPNQIFSIIENRIADATVEAGVKIGMTPPVEDINTDIIQFTRKEDNKEDK